MRNTLAVLALGLTLLSTACGSDPEPSAAPTAAATAAVASPSTAASAATGDIAAACTAADKADADLIAVLEKINDKRDPMPAAEAVKTALAAYQKNVKELAKAATMTSDAEVRTALEAAVASRTDIAAALKDIGVDLRKLRSVTTTAADVQAGMGLWRYPDGVCGAYVS